MQFVCFCLRLRPGTSLFDRLPPRISSVSRSVKPSCACVKRGNRRFNTCDVKPLPDTDKGGKPVKPIKVPPRPRKPGKNDNKDYDPNAINYVFKPPKVNYKVPSWPTRTGITRKRATAHCRKLLKNSRAARVCRKVVSTKRLKLLKECVTDIKVGIQLLTWVLLSTYWLFLRGYRGFSTDILRIFCIGFFIVSNAKKNRNVLFVQF